MKILDQIRELVTGTTVFREPYEKNGVTVIAALKVSGGGGGGEDASAAGGGGVGLDARPAGAFVIKGEDVSWIPAIDLNRSGTRREDLLLTEMELTRVYLLRNFLSDMPPAEAIDFLLGRMRKTKNNKEFLDSMAKG